MNITNLIFEVLTAKQDPDSDSGSDDFQNAAIQGDLYEKVESITIRTGDVFGSELIINGDGSIGEANAFLDIQVYVMPRSNTLENRLQARARAEALAKETAQTIWQSKDLRGICTIGRILKRNDWVKPGSIKTPVAVLRIEINPQEK